MKIEPEYAENIIVAIVNENKLNWYIADKEIWYMDYEKRIDDFRQRGYDINLEYIDDLRKDILLLDGSTIKQFQDKLAEYRVSTEELNQSLKDKKENNHEWYYDYSPSLYIDFDKKIFYSCYREMADYKSYVPTGWYAEYKEFLEEVQQEYKYWSDIENKNYFNDN